MSTDPSGVSQDSSTPPEAAANSASAKSVRHRLGWRITTVIVLLVAGFLVWRVFSNKAKAHTLQAQTSTLPVVAVTKATREELYNEVYFPAEFRPYLQVELHAKVSGYVE